VSTKVEEEYTASIFWVDVLWRWMQHVLRNVYLTQIHKSWHLKGEGKQQRMQVSASLLVFLKCYVKREAGEFA
jgi:hypothetical protein